jgi:hypothetical protein
MYDEYLANYPPESFYEYEGRGGYVPAEPSGAPGAAAALTREELEQAEAELASQLGTSAALVHDAALEFCGVDPRGNQDFVSLTQHGAALGQVALSTGVTSGGYTDPADEVARIAADAPWRSYSNRSGQRVIQPMVDPAKAARALQPAPERFREDPPEPQLTAGQESEIIRLANTDLRRARYPLVPGRRDKGSVTLANRKAQQYIELAESGATRTYTSNNGSVTVYEDDLTEPGQSFTNDEIDAEVARFHNMAAQLFGVTHQNDSGNRSYPPPDRSAFGQRTRPGSSWFSGQG